jgi:hypothetical protein
VDAWTGVDWIGLDGRAWDWIAGHESEAWPDGQGESTESTESAASTESHCHLMPSSLSYHRCQSPEAMKVAW